VLSEQERQEIETELAHYPYKQAVSIDALMIVQRHRGWISDAALQDVSSFLDTTVDELEALATFYPRIYRKPVGRHVVLYCDSVSCWIMGAERVRNELAERLGIPPGQTSQGGRFTLLPIVCLGACDRAPVMLVDDELYRELEPANIDEILAHYE
jgi:NADH-quinone oxidoreductase subunit E